MAEAQQAQAEATQQQTQAQMQMKQMEIEAKVKVAEIDANALLEATRMKIEGGQETQDFRQKHDLNMNMLNAENELGKKRFEQDLMNNSMTESDIEEDKKEQKS